MKKLNILLLATAFITFSCKKEAKATHIEGVGTTTNTSAQAKNSATSMLLPSGSTAPATGNTVQVGNQNSAAVTPGTALNPEHGKPGHRCDIPVGAPLNMPAGNSASNTVQATPSQPITINPTEMQPAATSAKQKTAPGMNPPHGEPGHRCDIAVGAPLNSPAGNTSTPPTPAQTVTTASKPLPATVAAPSTPALDANGKALAVNPAHGEPGHRCDIAVGAPLK